jgi:guanylate kinase
VDAGGFLEWVTFLDYLQGTPRPDPPAGQDVVLEIDVYGARQVRETFPDALLIWMDAPSRDEQRKRLEARGDRPDRIEARLALAEKEAAVARELGATVVINEDVDQTAATVAQIIEDARGRFVGPGG